MRHKINSHGQGLASLYPIKIWAILGKSIKKAMEEMGTRNRRKVESCIHPFGSWHVNSQKGQKSRAEKPPGLQIMQSSFSSQKPECW